jgi:Trypsin-like peptidase domain
MRSLFTLIVLLVPCMSYAGEPSVAERLEQASVTIMAGRAEGSGAFIKTQDGRAWLITAGHVVQNLRQERDIIDGAGHSKKQVSFPDVQIFQLAKENGRKVGESRYDAQVIRYSSPEYGDDLALLRVRAKGFKPASVLDGFIDGVPTVGTQLIHCGSLLGDEGNNSITGGLLSATGRVFSEKLYDQTSCTAMPGSSGGAVVRADNGLYVGMLVRGAGEGFNLVVPSRRIKDWSSRVGVDFLTDPTKAVPSDEELKKKPIEEPESSAKQSTRSSHDDDAYGFLIRVSK